MPAGRRVCRGRRRASGILVGFIQRQALLQRVSGSVSSGCAAGSATTTAFTLATPAVTACVTLFASLRRKSSTTVARCSTSDAADSTDSLKLCPARRSSSS